MFRQAAYAALAAAAFIAAPASAAVVYTDFNTDTDLDGSGNVILLPAGPGAVARAISFDVTTGGAFTAVFEFINPFSPAAAGGSATFNFDPDVVTFTGGDISGGGTAVPNFGIIGNSININRANLAAGPQTLTISGILTPSTAPGGNAFARIGGELTLTGVVPEPGTWALFILGFGLIGVALRRRSGAVRVSKAKLHFA